MKFELDPHNVGDGSAPMYSCANSVCKSEMYMLCQYMDVNDSLLKTSRKDGYISALALLFVETMTRDGSA
jgi:hypothetical protein